MAKTDLTDKQFWNFLGETVQQGIRENSRAKGLDNKGNPFPEYSLKYKEFKQKKGLSTKPNLLLTGSMWQSFSVHNVKNNGCEVGWISKVEATKAHSNANRGIKSRVVFDEKQYPKHVEVKADKMIDDRFGKGIKNRLKKIFNKTHFKVELPTK